MRLTWEREQEIKRYLEEAPDGTTSDLLNKIHGLMNELYRLQEKYSQLKEDKEDSQREKHNMREALEEIVKDGSLQSDHYWIAKEALK